MATKINANKLVMELTNWQRHMHRDIDLMVNSMILDVGRGVLERDSIVDQVKNYPLNTGYEMEITLAIYPTEEEKIDVLDADVS